jgi:acyl-CoA synthetase (NDP forming)
MDFPQRLRDFFRPEGIALFGSMKEGWFFGAAVVVKELQNLGYQGAIYPVNPSATSVYGLKVYPDISKVEGKVDLAVIITSCKYVPEILRSCGKKAIKAAVVVSDGFAENGPAGVRRQEEIVQIARSYGIRIIGPNTLGIYSPAIRLSTIPYWRLIRRDPDGHVRTPGRGT